MMVGAGCPGDETLAAAAGGRLEGAARTAFDEHVQRCADCAVVFAALSTSAETSHDNILEKRRDLPAGTRLARFVVMQQLVIGGMGVVYRAHDPALARPVALKLLR